MYKFAAVLALAGTASAAVFNVTVGVGGFVYTPNSITAQVGDVVSFIFQGSPGGHSVSQSSFSAPCEQLAGGFDSDFVIIPSGFTGTPPTWDLTITNASTPIWFYCKQTNPTPHCIRGMVGAINAPSSGNTVAAFQSAAMALKSLPAQTQGSLTGKGAQATALPGPLTAGASQPADASGLLANGTAAPTGTAASTGTGAPASGTSPATSPSPTNSAVMVNTGSMWYLLAGLFGIMLV